MSEQTERKDSDEFDRLADEVMRKMVAVPMLSNGADDCRYSVQTKHIATTLRAVHNRAVEDCAMVANKSLEHSSADKFGNRYWIHCSDVSSDILRLRKDNR